MQERAKAVTHCFRCRDTFMTELETEVSPLIYLLRCDYVLRVHANRKLFRFEFNTMSFYHVLPSNTSPSYFPKNNASEFSTPSVKPYTLKGKWEVALMNMTYSNCIYTFDNDVIVVEENCSVETRLSEARKPIKVMLSLPTSKKPLEAAEQVSKEIQLKFKNLLDLKLTSDKEYCSWHVTNDNYFIIVSRSVKDLFILFSDVITPWDSLPSNYFSIQEQHMPLPTKAEDMFIILVPLTYNRKDILLKEANEVISAETLLNRFNTRVPKDIASLTFNSNHYCVYKQADQHALLYSKDLLKVFSHRQGGLYDKGNQQFWGYDFSRGFKTPWYVSIYKLDVIESESSNLTKAIILDRQQIRQHCDVISYLNAKIDDKRIIFSCNEANYLQLKITDKTLSVHFDDTLRDIFAFDKNDYTGQGEFSASDVFSLTRRIQFLYVYSNVGDMVRIGDTEAPILAVLPLANSSPCRLIERVFKSPIYVNVPREHISQIDIGIYDGAGKTIPFLHDSVTTLRLHFRQV